MKDLLIKYKWWIIILLMVVFLLYAQSVQAKTLPGNKQLSYLDDATKPQSIQNNNPGNIRIDSANDWDGKVPEHLNTDGAFEQFYDYHYGIRALIVLLKNYINAGHDTLQKIVYRYAPPAENNTSGYVANLATWTGLSQAAPISASKENLRKLTIAIARGESGVNSVTNEQFDTAYNLI